MSGASRDAGRQGNEAGREAVSGTAPSGFSDALRASVSRSYARAEIGRLLDGIPSRMLSAEETMVAGNPARPLLEFLKTFVDVDKRLAEGAVHEKDQAEYGKFELVAEHAAFDSLLDYVRTKKFCHAIRAHLTELEELHPSGEIVVVDAGCGPIPILSIVAALHSPRIKVVAIESNHSSQKIAQEFFDKLGIADQVELRKEDAAKAKLAGPVHLLVSETLNTAFISEGFAYIMKNLVPQLGPEARTIPMHVTAEGAIEGESPKDRHRREVRYFPEPLNIAFASYPDLTFVPFCSWDREHHTIDEVRFRCDIPWVDIDSGAAAGILVRSEMVLYAPSSRAPSSSGSGERQVSQGVEPIVLGPDESLITRTERILCFAESVRLQRQFNPKYSDAPGYRVSVAWKPGQGDSDVPLMVEALKKLV